MVVGKKISLLFILFICFFLSENNPVLNNSGEKIWFCPKYFSIQYYLFAVCTTSISVFFYSYIITQIHKHLRCVFLKKIFLAKLKEIYNDIINYSG